MKDISLTDVFHSFFYTTFSGAFYYPPHPFSDGAKKTDVISWYSELYIFGIFNCFHCNIIFSRYKVMFFL